MTKLKWRFLNWSETIKSWRQDNKQQLYKIIYMSVPHGYWLLTDVLCNSTIRHNQNNMDRIKSQIKNNSNNLPKNFVPTYLDVISKPILKGR